VNLSKLFILFTFFTSCSNQPTDNRILEFEKILGRENIETLNYLVSDFENDYLKNQYPTLKTEDAYLKFLNNLLEDKILNWGNYYKKNKEFFNKSQLIKELYRFPDSVWIIENSNFDKVEDDSIALLYSKTPYIKMRYKELNENEDFEYYYSRLYTDIKPNTNYDSIINSTYKRAEFNGAGKYIQALFAIKDTDTFTNKYFDVKQNGGILPLKFFIKGALSLDPNFNDYFHKRIVLLEVVY